MVASDPAADEHGQEFELKAEKKEFVDDVSAEIKRMRYDGYILR